MRYEWLQLIKWVIVGSRYLDLVKWIAYKGNQFYSKKVNYRYSIKAYPEDVSRLSYCALFENTRIQSKIKTNLITQSSFNVDSIVIASKELKIQNGSIDWSLEFDDPEDEESLHRWNWLVYQLSLSCEDNKKDLITWAALQQQKWIDLYQSEILKNETGEKLRWESYTVSERISNSAVFFIQSGGWPSNKISNAIQDQVYFLIKNLEYIGGDTGNHVINNARAIYLAGVVFDCDGWRKLAFSIIEREIPFLVTKDGFMREGSSHYQFLFTRWILEINYFASIVRDVKVINFLASFIRSLIQRCQFFLVFNKEKQEWDIPLFGDISPDFQPEWLLYLPWSSLARQFVISPHYTPDIHTPSWNSLWLNKGYSDLPVSPNNKGQPSPINHGLSDFIYPESGWFRVDYCENTLFYRVDPNASLDYVGHHHHDLFHFCLYHKGVPIFVDAGRKNYGNQADSWGRFGLSPRSHNSVMIDGVGSLPENPNRYPGKYIETANQAKIEQLNESVLITIESTCFQRLLSPVTVIRRIFLNFDTFKIEDELIGYGEHYISSFFHCASGLHVRIRRDNSWSLKSSALTTKFYLNKDNPLKVSLKYGDDNHLGWVVPSYGKIIASPTLVIEGKVQLPITLKYNLDLEV